MAGFFGPGGGGSMMGGFVDSAFSGYNSQRKQEAELAQAQQTLENQKAGNVKTGLETQQLTRSMGAQDFMPQVLDAYAADPQSRDPFAAVGAASRAIQKSGAPRELWAPMLELVKPYVQQTVQYGTSLAQTKMNADARAAEAAQREADRVDSRNFREQSHQDTLAMRQDAAADRKERMQDQRYFQQQSLYQGNAARQNSEAEKTLPIIQRVSKIRGAREALRTLVSGADNGVTGVQGQVRGALESTVGQVAPMDPKKANFDQQAEVLRAQVGEITGIYGRQLTQAQMSQMNSLLGTGALSTPEKIKSAAGIIDGLLSHLEDQELNSLEQFSDVPGVAPPPHPAPGMPVGGPAPPGGRPAPGPQGPPVLPPSKVMKDAAGNTIIDYSGGR